MENDAGFVAAGRRGLECEKVENGEALEGAAARDRVVAGLVAADAARALRDVERDAQAGAVELVGELGAFEREPADHVRAEGESEAVGVETVQGSDWREGCNGSGGGIHDGTFLRAQGVALTRQGHAFGRTRLLDPADADAASLVTSALRGRQGRFAAGVVAVAKRNVRARHRLSPV